MKVLVFGGTFNPLHYGHLRVAEEVRESLGAGKVIFMPVNIAPHKNDGELLDVNLRLEMVRIAVSDNPYFFLSDMEIKRGGRSYTIDTVKELKKDAVEPIIIVGADSFNEITTWCEYEELLFLTDFAIVPRPGYPVKKIGEALPVELAKKFWYDENEKSWLSASGTRISYIETTLMDISSSEIRRRIRQGLSIRYLMPPKLEDYIVKEKLYRGDNRP